jgi:hypothetical protein
MKHTLNPESNLGNGAGLPASPFRTDDCATTKGARVAELSRLLRRNEAAIYKTLSRRHQALRQCINERLATQEGA